ncbi:MAG: phage holin family protein [Comamonadaceae bacterium]|nr:MAG: phage holin family protein [Comamonadaceae bacterium]
MSGPAPHGGLFASLRQMLGTLVEIAQVRVQLLGNELEAEKLRIAGGLLLAGVGLMLLTVGTVLLCALVLMLFADGYRLAALAVLTLAFIAGGALLIRAAGSRLRNPGGMFAATLAELADDRAGLAPRE